MIYNNLEFCCLGATVFNVNSMVKFSQGFNFDFVEKKSSFLFVMKKQILVYRKRKNYLMNS